MSRKLVFLYMASRRQVEPSLSWNLDHINKQILVHKLVLSSCLILLSFFVGLDAVVYDLLSMATSFDICT